MVSGGLYPVRTQHNKLEKQLVLKEAFSQPSINLKLTLLSISNRIFKVFYDMKDKLGLMKITHAAKKTHRPRQKTEKHLQIIYTVSVDFKNSELTHFVQIKTDTGATCWN